MTTPRKRSTKSKEEVTNEFDTVVDKHSNKESVSSKEADAVKQHQAEVLAKIASMTPESVTQAVTAAQFDIQKTLGSVSQLLVEKTQELQTVDEAIQIQRIELERLHGVDVVQSAIDLLITEHAATKDKLADEIFDTRQLWLKERQEHDQLEVERKQELQKTRQREDADHRYQLQQTRKSEQDAWNEQVRREKLEHQLQHEAKERNWAEREAKLAAQEKDIENLRNDAAMFATKVSVAEKAAVAVVTNTLSKDHKHAIEMMENNAKATITILQSKIAQLEQTVSQTAQALAETQARLQTAYEKNAEVANKALESASGQSAMAAVSKFASEIGSNGSTKRS